MVEEVSREIAHASGTEERKELLLHCNLSVPHPATAPILIMSQDEADEKKKTRTNFMGGLFFGAMATQTGHEFTCFLLP